MLRGVPKMTLRLTDEARAGWEKACVTTGVSLTALVEAIGRDLNDSGRLLERGADLIEAARVIDLERRRRR